MAVIKCFLRRMPLIGPNLLPSLPPMHSVAARRGRGLDRGLRHPAGGTRPARKLPSAAYEQLLAERGKEAA